MKRKMREYDELKGELEEFNKKKINKWVVQKKTKF